MSARRTKASRREAFRWHCALPVRYTGASTAEGRRFIEALRSDGAAVWVLPDGRISVVPRAHAQTVNLTIGYSTAVAGEALDAGQLVALAADGRAYRATGAT